MDAEKVYVIAKELKDKLVCEDLKDIDIIPDLIKLIEMSKSEMYAKELKRDKKFNQYKVMQRILRRTADNPRECLRYSYIHTDGLQYVCDTFVMVASLKHYDLPLSPREVGYFNIDRVKPCYLEEYAHQLKLPEISLLKAEIKIAKKRKQAPVYFFGEGYQYVSAEYLLDILEAFESPRAVTYADKPDSNVKSIEINCPNGDYGLLMPLRPSTTKKRIEDNLIYLITPERS